MDLVTIVLAAGLAMPFILAIWAAAHHQRLAPEAAAEPEPPPPTAIRPPLEARSLDISRFLHDTAFALADTAASHGVRISLAVSPGRQVWADPHVLAFAVRSAVAAGIRASPGGRVLVSALPLGASVDIAVTDDGAHDNRDARAACLRDTAGAIVMMGGSLAVESRPGRSTTVTLRLPRAPAAAPPAEQAAITVQAA